LAEAKVLIEAGHREIVLTGVNLGAYGLQTTRHQGHNPQLTELICRLAELPGMSRLRLSSIDPSQVSRDLLAAMARYPNVMPHLHLPLQSGSDRILRLMGRRYQRSMFIEAVQMTRELLDRPAITTDVIIGFPGETEEDFRQTIDLASQVVFAKIHVFPYSVRPGTAASELPNPVSPAVVKQRCRLLNELQRELGRQYRAQFIGHDAQVLVETQGSRPTGLSERYFKVYIDQPCGPRLRCNQIVTARLIGHHADGLMGVASPIGDNCS
jgi:threonylcarbamoyladenosine tRNA methylthiotransferase MtaB